MELKRGSTKEKWGLTLMHRTGEGNRIELGVSKVWKFFLGHFHNNLLRWQCSAQPPRPASCLATLWSSSTTGRWRPWSRWASTGSLNIKWHAGPQADSALSILLAAGFSVQLAWITSKDPLDPGSWQQLHTLWYKPDSYKYNNIKIVRSLSSSMNRFISEWTDYENPKGHMSCFSRLKVVTLGRTCSFPLLVGFPSQPEGTFTCNLHGCNHQFHLSDFFFINSLAITM